MKMEDEDHCPDLIPADTAPDAQNGYLPHNGYHPPPSSSRRRSSKSKAAPTPPLPPRTNKHAAGPDYHSKLEAYKARFDAVANRMKKEPQVPSAPDMDNQQYYPDTQVTVKLLCLLWPRRLCRIDRYRKLLLFVILKLYFNFFIFRC